MFSKIKSYLMDDYQYNILFLVLFFVNFLSGLLIVRDNLFLKESVVFYVMIGIFFLLEVGYYIYLKNVDFNSIKLEKIFLVLVVPIGFCYMILFPLGATPDEQTHYARAFEISNGYLVSDFDKAVGGGRVMPVNAIRAIYNKNYNDILIKLDEVYDGKEQFFGFSNTSLYSFLCYLPQSLGMLFSRLLGLSYTIQGYFGRLFSFFTMVFCIYHSIRILPFRKLSLLCLMMLPMMMQEAISLSPDALTIGCSFLLVSYVFYLKYSVEKINGKDKFILAILSLILSLCKIVYIPLCFVLFLIPKDKFKSAKEKYIYVGFVILFAILFNLLWLKISFSYLIEYNEGVNSSEQVKYILTHIHKYIIILFKTISDNFEGYLSGFVGSSLGWFTINLPSIYTFSLYGILFYFFLSDNNINHNKIDAFSKIFCIVLIISCVLLIFTSLYVQWTKLTADKIEGVQGRYFIPISLLFFLTCSPMKKNFKQIKLSLNTKICNCFFLCLIFINIFVLYLIMCRFC